MMSEYFKNVVSQEIAKGQVSFHLDNYKKNQHSTKHSFDCW